MSATIVVREYARLTTSPLEKTEITLDQARISETAFDWLCELAGKFRSCGASLLQLDGCRWLKLDNYVGVLESPCGQVIEVLPKHCDAEKPGEARALLCRMIEAAMNLTPREITEASLQLSSAPLSEWVIRRFLDALDHLIKRGLRFDYLRIEEEQRYLRGQMDVAKQIRQPPGKQHFFQIRHDIFLPDRPENRLLKSALDLICKETQEPKNWRLAHELAGMLHELPESRQIEQDFRLWRNDRLMAHYRPIKPWCELILRQQMPLAVKGDWRGVSFLFPMERLFERYVEVAMRNALLPNAKLSAQVKNQYLCEHRELRDKEPKSFFQLKPDLLIEQGSQQWILDTKWKLLDGSDRGKNYGLSQSDFYQLFAYGHKYLGGTGELILIYPYWGKFTAPLELFDFGNGLSMHVLPFDLESNRLICNGSSSLPLKPQLNVVKN